MKRKGIIVTCAALVVAGIAGYGISQTKASATTEQESREVATHYLNALNEGNASEAAKFVQDYRFNTQEEIVEGYNELLKTDPIANAKVISVSAEGGNRATVTVRLTSQNAGDMEQTLAVEKISGEWKVILDQTPMVKAMSKKSVLQDKM